ncbi:MAG: glycosyl transferase [Pseudomonadota bacterium]
MTEIQKKTHVFTSAALNYIPKARVLFESLRKHHPDWVLHLALADELRGEIDLSAEPFDYVMTIDALGIPDYSAWAFTHTIVELATAIKPFALKKLLEREDCAHAIYLDPDIVVFSPLDDILSALQQSSILLVPHQTDPEMNISAVMDNEIGSLKHGVYNLGFIGVSPTGEGLRFARWWAERLYYFCRSDICNGLFTDQRWIDLVPAFFDDVGIIRSTRHDVATWNLTTRTLIGDFVHGFTVDGKQLGFYHFTGFDKGDHHIMAAKNASGNESVVMLMRWYTDRIGSLGRDPLSRVPWFFGAFDNDEPVTRSQRVVYRERVDLQRAYPNPLLSTGYLQWWRKQAPREYPELFDDQLAPAALERLSSRLTPGFCAGVEETRTISLAGLFVQAMKDRRTAQRLASRSAEILRTEGMSGLLRRLKRY